jgi:hypothetical protein
MAKKWMLDLEILENEDEFFQTLEYANQHRVLKSFILDMLKANGFDSRIRLSRYEEVYGDEEEFESASATPDK